MPLRITRRRMTMIFIQNVREDVSISGLGLASRFWSDGRDTGEASVKKTRKERERTETTRGARRRGVGLEGCGWGIVYARVIGIRKRGPMNSPDEVNNYHVTLTSYLINYDRS